MSVPATVPASSNPPSVRAMVIPTSGEVRFVQITTLKDMQNSVGGYIEHIRQWTHDGPEGPVAFALYADEEAKLKPAVPTNSLIAAIRDQCNIPLPNLLGPCLVMCPNLRPGDNNQYVYQDYDSIPDSVTSANWATIFSVCSD